MKPVFFKTPADFRQWLDQNHDKEAELLVGFYKVGTGRQSITWPKSVSEALCYGWIDGVRRTIDEESYSIRFTPRRANSIWSAVNIKKMEELLAQGLVKPAGLAAYEKREEKRSAIYSHEQEEKDLTKEFEREFKKDKPAWAFFIKQAPSYRKRIIHWIVSARQEKTKRSRFEKLLEASKEGKRIL